MVPLAGLQFLYLIALIGPGRKIILHLASLHREGPDLLREAPIIYHRFRLNPV